VIRRKSIYSAGIQKALGIPNNKGIIWVNSGNIHRAIKDIKKILA
jgi:hypothetical protein